MNLGGLLPLLLMFVIFYFLLIRPQQKRQKAVREMQTNLKKGDAVVTIGGLHGTIDTIDENTVSVRSKDGSVLTFDRQAVREIKQA
ncbi:preprotein translocase subunit YajC [Fictibacillus aquaticus]|uniref:Preprotein translocase subunit YajC n=1 Tax=Fictibacillus aquaticus TaxID=2021314 RepID=A0A235FAP6_9BACL|nr:preprotein translocase subunit YajC [Fictibacillus aquaticus]OYD58043.1 preprotein translocase subunit YajC [Fictibacillus aquaticus]